MGQVFFDTEIQKTVDITKTVDLDVFKNVDATVNIDGKLATAEASADALSSFNQFFTILRLIDNFNEDQFVRATSESLPPGGEVFFPISQRVLPIPSDTDLPPGANLREGVIEFADTGGGVPQSAAIRFDSGAGDVVFAFERLGGTQTVEVTYGDETGGNPLNISGIGGDPNAGFFLTGINNSAPGFSVEIRLTDTANPTQFLSATEVIPFADFADPSIDVFFPITDFTGGSTSISNFDTITFKVIPPADPLSSEELVIDDFIIGRFDPLNFTLAGTDTFAQVSDAGAFSFSESLAAASAVETDMLLG